MERPSRTSTLIAAVIVVLLLPIVTNVAAGVLPTLIHPYLWLAWPVAGLLTIPVVVSEVRRRRSQREPGSDARQGYQLRQRADASRSGS